MIIEHKNFIDADTLMNLWHHVTLPHWRFGQKSNDDTLYPMWVQNFYDTHNNLPFGYNVFSMQ